MTQELFYTSAPRGLRPGSRGFCTVMSTSGMAKNLADRLEAFSGYRHVFAPNDPQALLNPVVFSHLRITVGGKPFHVLSRVSAAGSDYTQRSNKFAHHVVLEPKELVPAGPAALLAAVGFMESAWEGEPRVIDSARQLPTVDAPAAVCDNWRSATGDAGWAGVLAETATKASSQIAAVIFQPGMDTLALVAEALGLLPVPLRWQVTFSTYFTKLPPDVECQWRFVLAGSPEAKAVERSRQALVINLCTPLGRAPDGPWVEAARTGTPPETRIAVPAKPIVEARQAPLAEPVDEMRPIDTGVQSHNLEWQLEQHGGSLPPAMPRVLRSRVQNRNRTALVVAGIIAGIGFVATGVLIVVALVLAYRMPAGTGPSIDSDPNSSATVADNTLRAGKLTAPDAIEQVPTGIATLFDFTDARSNPKASEFSATINWGDGKTDKVTSEHSPAGQIVANKAGGFDVVGEHVYAKQNGTPFSVSVTSHNSTISASTDEFSVKEWLRAGKLTAPDAIEQVPTGIATLFDFTDARSNPKASEFSATINWGDGKTDRVTSEHSPAGQIVANKAGGFDVVGEHVYVKQNGTPFSVSVTSHNSTISASTDEFSVKQSSRFKLPSYFDYSAEKPPQTTGGRLRKKICTLGGAPARDYQISLIGKDFVLGDHWFFSLKTIDRSEQKQVVQINVENPNLGVVRGAPFPVAQFEIANDELWFEWQRALVPETRDRAAQLNNCILGVNAQMVPLRSPVQVSPLLVAFDGKPNYVAITIEHRPRAHAMLYLELTDQARAEAQRLGYEVTRSKAKVSYDLSSSQQHMPKFTLTLDPKALSVTLYCNWPLLDKNGSSVQPEALKDTLDTEMTKLKIKLDAAKDSDTTEINTRITEVNAKLHAIRQALQMVRIPIPFSVVAEIDEQATSRLVLAEAKIPLTRPAQ